MSDAHNDFNINVTLAALAYRAAQTEIMATHQQGVFLDRTSTCGTSACLAGHILILGHGSYDAAQDPINRQVHADVRLYDLEATRLLLGGDPETFPCTFREINFPDNVHRMIKDLCGGMFHSGIFYEMDEEEALRGFKQWVEDHTSEEAYRRFETLIEKDPDVLLNEYRADIEEAA